MAKNNFAERLQYLLHITNTKNSTLAKAVQYDLSYISKWLSGKMLPSEKNVEEVIEHITTCLIEMGEEKLKEEYGCSGEELKKRLSDDLRTVYNKCRVKDKEDYFLATRPIAEVISSIDKRILDRSSVVAVLDILSLPHENRLVLAGIKDGHFSYGVQNTEYSMVISLHSGDCVYDAIFLIHMLTSFSGMNFKLYNDAAAGGKFIYCLDESAVSGFLFPGSKELVSVGELGNGKKIRQSVEPLLDQEKLIFKKTTMQDMIDHHDYIRSMFSSPVRWLIGHAMELLLPEEVFEELVKDRKDRDECRKLYRLSQSVLSNSQTKVMIYESAIAGLAVDGELDFYNEEVLLSPKQILCCLDYYAKLTDMGADIRLIEGGFSSDFRYITNPCLFLSDAVCYVRLENHRYENNILVINDRESKELFDRFYDTVWTDRPDVVTGDKEKIRRKMEHFCTSAEILVNA